MTTINPDIAKAIKNFKASDAIYKKPEDYYKGSHDLAFATDKFKNAFGTMFREFALNLCPAVVDAVRDNLKLTEFRVEKGAETTAVEAWKIWQLNRMGKRSGEVHKEAVKTGDAYVIVWPDTTAEGKPVTIYPQKARSCTVIYDEETPGKILWAAKYWRTPEKKYRLNLYYPDRIEKYITKGKDLTALPEATAFEPFGEGEAGNQITNPYGIVPVFHFANNADIGLPGESELTQAIPVQDAMNKSVLDMLVAMEFSSFRQRWISGIEIEYDDEGKPKPPFVSGADRLWITESPETKFGDFEATDLDQFLKVKESFRVDIAAVTGTPMWYLMQTKGDFPSGEALRKSETRFTKKVRDRQESFGQVWEDVMAFALRIEGKGEKIRLFADWEDPSPLSEKEALENIALKQDIGISDEQALIEAGYGEAEIETMLNDKEEKAKREVKRFNAGEGSGSGGVEE
jgi:Phage portal protein, SPP1 Gp6-like